MQINKTTYSNIKSILPYLGFALIVFTAKLIIIANYGNATPFWDQWNTEADHLYRPLIEGNLKLVDLFAPSNEHRVFTTRLFDIVLLYLNNGVWNPILQMQVSAGIHVLALTLLLFHIAKALTPSHKKAMLVFCTILFSIPFGYTNTLWGFQVHFYFLLLFSFIFLWGISAYKSYSYEWWLGFVAGILCPLSLASGAFTLLAGALILAIKRILTSNKNDIAITTIVLLITLAGVSIVFTPTLRPIDDNFNIQSIFKFWYTITTLLSWPDTKFGIGLMIIHIPALWLFFNILRKPDFQTAPLFFITAITLWLLGQFVAIAYVRGQITDRYLDLLAIGLVTNFAAIAILFNYAHLKRQLLFAGFWGIWITTVTFSFAPFIIEMNKELQSRFKGFLEMENNVRGYLCTGDFSYLQKPIPFYDPVRFKSLLDNQTIRSILPGNIYGPNANHSIEVKAKSFCDPMYYHIFPFYIIEKIKQKSSNLVNASVIIKNEWTGADYYSIATNKTTLPGFKVIGSFTKGEELNGELILHLHRGDKIWFRSEIESKKTTYHYRWVGKSFHPNIRCPSTQISMGIARIF